MLIGCSSARHAYNPHLVEAADCDQVFDAVIEVLRDHRFVVNRMDRRAGRITTYPRTASSFFEPWHADADSPLNDDNTFNHQRRTVRVGLKPGDVASDCVLTVEVQLERRQHPQRHLNSAAFAGGVHFVRGQGIRSVRTERGDQQSFWRGMGTDEHYAARLVHDILERAGQPIFAANTPLSSSQ